MRPIVDKARRSHHKRRTGCKECKARKVKCDESKPSCRTCVKRKAQCSFTSSTLDERGNNDGSPTSSEPPRIRELSPLTLNLANLELLHHFTTVTCFTFSSDPITQTIWRVLAPQHGLSHEFVLHSLLAVAGLHLAFLNLSKSTFYTAQAMLHHQASSTVARPMVSSLTSGNSSSLFLFSVLTSYFALASPRLTANSKSSIPRKEASIPAWLFLIQGTRSILERKADIIRSSIFSTMILNQQDLKIWGAAAMKNDAFQSLRELISSSFTEHRLSLTATATCSTALEQLAKMFTVAYEQIGSNDYTRQILLWMMIIPDAFITFLQDRNAEALCIFGYYCVLLKKLDSLWFIHGWSEDLIENIYWLLVERHRGYIVWPMQEIGWAPESDA
ncbi:hypothetical protein V8E51_008725 [Hyaloscypha variabilis]